jgi:hypothetical protein
MEYVPLPDHARTVFEWIAGHVESKVCFWFAEVKDDCGIDSDHELHTALTTLQEYPGQVGSHWPIVKAIYPEEEHGEGAFEVCAHADRAWAEYHSWESEHVCPGCHKPTLEKVTILRCTACGHEHDLSRRPIK